MKVDTLLFGWVLSGSVSHEAKRRIPFDHPFRAKLSQLFGVARPAELHFGKSIPISRTAHQIRGVYLMSCKTSFDLCAQYRRLGINDHPLQTSSIHFALLWIVAFMVLSADCAWPATQGPIFLSPVAYSSSGADIRELALGDVNGDGKLDIVTANLGGASASQFGIVQVLLGNGDGTLQPGQSYTLTAGGGTAVSLADLDGDGKLDIVVSETNFTGCLVEDVVGVLLGNGDGTFRSEHTYKSGGLCAGRLVVSDINQDGKPDVVVVNKCVSN